MSYWSQRSGFFETQSIKHLTDNNKKMWIENMTKGHFMTAILVFKSNKKFSCRRQTVRCFVSLNILLINWWWWWSHSRSLQVIRNDTLQKGLCKSLLVFHCILKHSALNNGVTLKSGLEVVHGHWKWCRLIAHVRLIITQPL